MPKVDREAAHRYERQAYPGRLGHHTDGCWKTRLSDAVGLRQIGVGEVELLPGAATSLMHWHEHEDEFVYVLSGEVVLVEQAAGESVLKAGDCAGFPAGVPTGHTLENRSSLPARLLEIGTRAPRETAHYPGLDMIYRREGRKVTFESRDGRPIGPGDDVLPAD